MDGEHEKCNSWVEKSKMKFVKEAMKESSGIDQERLNVEKHYFNDI